MNCRDLEQLLADDPYMEISEEACLHLEQCEACRVLLKDLRALRELSSELRDRSEVPAFFETSVCSRAGRARHRYAYWPVIGTIAALVLFAVGVTRLSDQAPQSAPLSEENVPGVIDLETTFERARVSGISEDFVAVHGDVSQSQMISQPLEVILPTIDAPGFLLELPARIEVRQTQAENDFYLKSVSH